MSDNSIRLDAYLTARIVEWDSQKGYGFLQVGKLRLFLHIREFAERHKKPEVGDTIRFLPGQDARGRNCATHATHVNDGGRFTLLNLVLLAGLLVLPVIALQRTALDWRWLLAIGLALSAATYGAYAWDKRLARDQEWRLPEARLHLLELLGGWPGAFVAQRRLRHKCSKVRFQAVFWLIVLIYQFAAFDSLQQWSFSRGAWDQLARTFQHRN